VSGVASGAPSRRNAHSRELSRGATTAVLELDPILASTSDEVKVRWLTALWPRADVCGARMAPKARTNLEVPDGHERELSPTVGTFDPTTSSCIAGAPNGNADIMTRRAAVIAALMAAAAVALGGCGGGSQPTASTAGRPVATTGGATSTSPAPPAATRRVAWPQRKLVRRLRGRIISVEGRRVEVDRTTITCQGIGRAQRRDHTLAWTRFHCVQPTFPAGAVAGPDAVFDVHPTGPRSLRVAAARFAR
jgi:hypothetical protein